MSQSDNLYAHYLSNHFIGMGDARQIRARKTAILKKNYLSLLPKKLNAKILEIGPGHGELLEVLKIQGYTNIQAIDLSEEVAKYCNQHWPGSTTVVEDTKTFMSDHPDTFDMVFMMHVLEHVPKEQIIPLLTQIRKALADKGQLIIEVPNMANPVTGLYTRYVDFTHEVGFVDSSLAFVLKEAGFNKIAIRALKIPNERWYRLLQIGFNWIFDLCYRLLQFGLGVKASRLTAHAIFAHTVK